MKKKTDWNANVIISPNCVVTDISGFNSTENVGRDLRYDTIGTDPLKNVLETIINRVLTSPKLSVSEKPLPIIFMIPLSKVSGS